MGKLVASVGSALILGTFMFGLMTSAIHGQVEVRTQSESERKLRDVQRDSDRIMSKIYRSIAERDKFMAEFLLLSPQSRIKLWSKNHDGMTRGEITHALIARGTDTVPYLAEIIRNGDSDDGIRAVILLCDMDRFVAEKDLPIPDFGGSIYVKALALMGRVDPFMMVDGRRIGKEGYDVIMWAAQQKKHDRLRLYARKESGLLEQDLRRLSFNELIEQWRKAAIENKGLVRLDEEASILMDHLELLLIEQAPETIPPLINILENDPDGYLRETALLTLYHIDSRRMRLRTTTIGRGAIDAILKALDRGGLKPMFAQRGAQEWIRKRIDEEIYKDNFDFHPSSRWTVIARAFETFYGERSTHKVQGMQDLLIKAKPEMRQFITYLTEVDPFFPSWEFTYQGRIDKDEVLHPRFETKMARYYEHWKRFKAKQVSQDTLR